MAKKLSTTNPQHLNHQDFQNSFKMNIPSLSVALLLFLQIPSIKGYELSSSVGKVSKTVPFYFITSPADLESNPPSIDILTITTTRVVVPAQTHPPEHTEAGNSSSSKPTSQPTHNQNSTSSRRTTASLFPNQRPNTNASVPITTSATQHTSSNNSLLSSKQLSTAGSTR